MEKLAISEALNAFACGSLLTFALFEWKDEKYASMAASLVIAFLNAVAFFL